MASLLGNTNVAGFTPFTLERYFAIYEFSGAKLLCCSDCEPLMQQEVLAMADDELKAMWDNLSLGYTESAGLPLLREEIASCYAGIETQHVTVLCPEEGIYLGLRALVEEGDEIVVSSPAYQSLTEVAQACGANIRRWEPTIAEDGSIVFRIEDFLTLVTEHTKLVVINFPHNPTSFQLSRSDFDTVVSTCSRVGCYLFSDEMYRGLEFNIDEQNPAVCEVYEKGVSLSGMSKVYAMPGLRIGWLSSKNEALNNKVRTLKDYTTICCSAPSEVLALIGLRNKKKIIARNLQIIHENTDAVDAFMKRFEKKFYWKRPRAGSFAFPSLKSKDKSILTLCQEWVEKGNVMLLPSTLYSFGDKHFRLGLGRKNLNECLSLWEAYLLHDDTAVSATVMRKEPNVFSCRKCGHVVFYKDELADESIHTVTGACESYFLFQPPDWMGVEEGKKNCPNCKTRLGALKWSGNKCSCGTWVAPAIQFPCSRLDAKHRETE